MYFSFPKNRFDKKIVACPKDNKILEKWNDTLIVYIGLD